MNNDVIFEMWNEINRLADLEDEKAIKRFILEIGYGTVSHNGTPPEDFTLEMVFEWITWNWLDIIDTAPMWLNLACNISLVQYEKAVDKFGYDQ